MHTSYRKQCNSFIVSTFILIAGLGIISSWPRVFAAGPNDVPTHGPSRPFEGTFADEKLTVTFAPDATIPGEAYSGDFTLGGATYRASGDARDGKLEGRFFDKEGHAFKFTAERSGDKLTFSTGGKTYKLTAKKKNG